MELKKIQYTGPYSIVLDCPGFCGRVEPGQEISVYQKALDELSGRNDFSIVTEIKKEKAAK